MLFFNKKKQCDYILKFYEKFSLKSILILIMLIFSHLILQISCLTQYGTLLFGSIFLSPKSLSLNKIILVLYIKVAEDFKEFIVHF